MELGLQRDRMLEQHSGIVTFCLATKCLAGVAIGAIVNWMACLVFERFTCP